MGNKITLNLTHYNLEYVTKEVMNKLISDYPNKTKAFYAKELGITEIHFYRILKQTGNKLNETLTMNKSILKLLKEMNIDPNSKDGIRKIEEIRLLFENKK